MPAIPADLLPKVINLLLDAICVVDTGGRFVFVSAAGERIFGYRPEEMVGRPVLDFVFEEDLPRTIAAITEIVAGIDTPHFENRYRRKDGSIAHIMWSARWSEDNQVRVAVARDVSGRKRAEALQASLYAISEAAYAAEDLLGLFRRAHEIIGGLLPAPHFFVALFDQAKDELSFPYHSDACAEASLPQTLAASSLSAEVIRTGRPVVRPPEDSAPDRHCHDGSPGAPGWIGVPLSTPEGLLGVLAVQGYSPTDRSADKDVELLQFVATQVAAAIERKQMENRLRHMALHDALTGLPNRRLLMDRMQTALARARRERTGMAVMYLDIDRFKQVNDDLGHAGGDLLLENTARRLGQCIRASDTVSRVGGDEFVVVLGGIGPQDDALSVAQAIRRTMNEPFDLAGQRVAVSSSIGIAMYPIHGEDREQLIRQADAAMYTSKREGGNCITVADTRSAAQNGSLTGGA
ncbi:MAG: diguanylate cyclase [Pseudomonadota bacterium]